MLENTNQVEKLLSDWLIKLNIEISTNKFKGITSGTLVYSDWDYTFNYSTSAALQDEKNRTLALYEAATVDSMYTDKIRYNLTLKMIDALTENGKFADDSYSSDKGSYSRRPLKVLQDYLDWLKDRINKQIAQDSPTLGLIVGGVKGEF